MKRQKFIIYVQSISHSEAGVINSCFVIPSNSLFFVIKTIFPFFSKKKKKKKKPYFHFVFLRPKRQKKRKKEKKEENLKMYQKLVLSFGFFGC